MRINWLFLEKFLFSSGLLVDRYAVLLIFGILSSSTIPQRQDILAELHRICSAIKYREMSPDSGLCVKYMCVCVCELYICLKISVYIYTHSVLKVSASGLNIKLFVFSITSLLIEQWGENSFLCICVKFRVWQSSLISIMKCAHITAHLRDQTSQLIQSLCIGFPRPQDWGWVKYWKC